MLVHSVDDHPVDAEFLELARTDKVVYITTLMAGEGYLQAGQGTVDGRRYPLDCADSMSRARVAGGPVHLAGGKEWWADTNVVRMIESQRSMAVANAKRVQDGGVTMAAGTDAGTRDTARPLVLPGTDPPARGRALTDGGAGRGHPQRGARHGA